MIKIRIFALNQRREKILDESLELQVLPNIGDSIVIDEKKYKIMEIIHSQSIISLQVSSSDQNRPAFW
jgi:hypothetical protein